MQLKVKFTQRSHNISIWTDCTIQQSHGHQDSCRHYQTAWKTNRYVNQATFLGVQY